MIENVQPENTEERTAAASRLRTYLQALQVTNHEQQERIVSAVLQRAEMKQAENPQTTLIALAMNEIGSLSDQWFEKLLSNQERPGVNGLVSLCAVDAADKWPAAFLAEQVPPELYYALRRCDVQAVPGLKVSRMVPQPFENPLQDVINLPSPLGSLSKERLSLVAKFSAFVISFFSIWSGHRMR